MTDKIFPQQQYFSAEDCQTLYPPGTPYGNDHPNGWQDMADRLNALLASRLSTWRVGVPEDIPADRVMGEGMLSIHPDVLDSISYAFREIGDMAHNASTGPEVPDVLWEIREKAYEAYIVTTDAEAKIMQAANAHAALSPLRANQGGDAP